MHANAVNVSVDFSVSALYFLNNHYCVRQKLCDREEPVHRSIEILIIVGSNGTIARSAEFRPALYFIVRFILSFPHVLHTGAFGMLFLV